MPVHMEERKTPLALSKNAMPYVGRYRVDISCSDPYVGCERGTANFILNLLADGTAHRSIVHMGKIMFNSSHQDHQIVGLIMRLIIKSWCNDKMALNSIMGFNLT